MPVCSMVRSRSSAANRQVFFIEQRHRQLLGQHRQQGILGNRPQAHQRRAQARLALLLERQRFIQVGLRNQAARQQQLADGRRLQQWSIHL